MWACLFRPQRLANNSAAITLLVVGALLTEFATGTAMARERLTIYMCRHGLYMAAVVVVCHLPLPDGCTGGNCASECDGKNCGCALPPVMPRLRL
jgi:hypothetical protein